MCWLILLTKLVTEIMDGLWFWFIPELIIEIFVESIFFWGQSRNQKVILYFKTVDEVCFLLPSNEQKPAQQTNGW